MLETIVGGPATGKTTACIKRLHELTRAEQPVIWVGEAHQRERTIERWLREPGTILNARFFTFQQLYYRILQNHPFIKPLASPGETLGSVARAIRRVFDRVPSPGEATLYLQGIREMKRSRLTASDLFRLTDDERIADLTRVFEAYDDLTANSWDKDDYRAFALDILKSTKPSLPHMIVDGIMDPDPADLLIVAALAEHTNVTMTFEEEPAGLPTSRRRTLTRIALPTPKAVTFPNAAKEARWVIRSVKHDLAEGVAPHEIAIVTTPEHKNAFLALAREAGVPTHDATPTTLAETNAARLLFRLLGIVSNPDPVALSAHPNLVELSRVIQALNVRGVDAVNAAAVRSGAWEALRDVRAAFTPPEDAAGMPTWIDSTLRSLAVVDPSLLSNAGYPVIRAALRQRGIEASTVTFGASMIGWWEHVCSLYPDPTERPHGVPVLTMTEATGLQFERAYVTEANTHQHRFGGSEDHFFPEDVRVGDGVTNAPRKRFNHRSLRVQRHARHRSEVTTVTFTTANQDGPTHPNALLVTNPVAAPELAAAHGREVTGASNVRRTTTITAVANGPARVRARTLETQITCGFRARFEKFNDEHRPTWVTLIGDLTREPHVDADAIVNLAAKHPTYEGWLKEHAAFIAAYELKHEIALTPEVTPPVVTGFVHGTRVMDDDTVNIMWFTSPSELNDGEINKKFMGSWEKTSVIRTLIEQHDFRRVIVTAVPIGANPRTIVTVSVDGADGSLPLPKMRLKANFQFALKSYSDGNVVPKPGFHCRSCRIADACRAHGG